MTFRVVHISDLHLANLSGTTVRSFLNKRITGGLNLVLRRAHLHRAEVVEVALEQIASTGFDHLVVTGDLSNLALDGEFQLARHLLATVGDGSRISVIPGNHDVYTPGAAREQRFEAYFRHLMESDLPELRADDIYPYVKLRGPVALVGLSSAVPSPPLMATGRISTRQLHALSRILAHREVRSRFAIAMVHHHLRPLTRRLVHIVRRLTNASELQRVLLHGGVGLVCHGHNHKPSIWRTPYSDAEGEMVISDSGSSSLAPSLAHRDRGTFKVYQVDLGSLTRITTYQYRPEPDLHSGVFLVSDEHTLVS